MLNARPEPQDDLDSDSPAPPVPLQAQSDNTAESPRRPSVRASLRTVLGGAVALAAVAMIAAGGFRILDVLLREGNTLPAFAAMIGGMGVLAGLLLWRAFAMQPRRPRWLNEASPGGAEGLSAFIRALPDAVVILDRSLKINFANRAAEELYGYEAGTLTGLDLRRLMMPKARSADERALRDAMADGNIGRVVRGLERTALRKDGREVTIEINAQSYATPDGPMMVTIVRNVTQRRANERALRRSRENLEAAQRIAHVGSFERNLVTGEIEWSDEFLRIWGLSSRPKDHSTEHLTGHVHPDDRQAFVAVRDAVVAGRVVPPHDFRLIHPDGTERILHNEYKIEFDEEGRPAHLHGTVQDVTEQKKTEIALGRSRENLEIAQRIARVGSFERNLVTGEVKWTDEFLRIWGLSSRPEDHSIEHVTSLVHPEDRRMFTEIREAVLAGKVVRQPDFRVIRPDGTQRTFHNEYKLELDELGHPIRLHGTVQDITERKQIENELRTSRENLARAQRLAGIGSFVHDLVSDRAEWSDQLYRLYGLSPDEGGGSMKLVLPHVHPEDREKFLAVKDQVAQRIRTSSLDFRLIGPDGTEQIFHRECDLTFDDDGKPIRMFGTIQDITARKQIELELRRSRESLARAQRFASIGSFQRHLGTGAVEFSDELYRIHGIEPGAQNVTLDRLRMLVHPEDRERVQDFRRGAEAGIPMPPIDYRIVRPDGVERVLHRECDILRDAAGKPIYLFGTLQDITERKKIENELRRSRENLARAHKVAGIGSFERDLVTGRLEWSDEFLKIWGLQQRPSHGTAELLLSLVHPEDRAKFMEGRDAALDRKRSLPPDFRIIRPDGQERILHRDYGVMFDEGGKATRMFGTVQDVTERKLAELEIQRSRENLARAQRIAAMGSFERDFITGKAEWSDEMYCILGIEKQEVKPGPELLMNFIHPEDREKFLAYRASERREQPSQPLEYRIIRPDGQERIVRRESVVVFDEEKRVVRVFGTLHDITEQRLAERRERELERQLLHSHKLEALGTLAGGIAHDLNNTLVPIMALSKLTARRFEAGSLVRRNLETIHEASERARDLVKRVVAFTRKDESEKRETDLAETVAEALKLLRATIPSSISFEEKIETVPPIPADASQIHQVVTNLVTNAYQAVGDDVGTITVTLGLVPGAGAGTHSEIRLSVSDTGMGMDEATQQRIFEPFFTTKPVGQGTGLGLSIVHGIVSGHGGRIEIKSTPGKGTRFDLFFPLPTEGGATSSRPAA
jgi:PAS domain S-box-containing protein